jgi:hypothetical protein
MSRRWRSGVRCNFCQQELWRIVGAPAGQDLYCYGCREPKDPEGTGHKDELAQGLRLGELPADIPEKERQARLNLLQERRNARLSAGATEAQRILGP